jgi:hypothetical protein
MDQGLYPWTPSPARVPVDVGSGTALSIALIVPIEHHGLNPAGKPFKHPGAMVTPYPDLRHYSSRDYGNRVGVFRILRLLKSMGLKATFPINAQALERFAPLVDQIRADGHEIAAYGLSTDHIHWSGLEPGIERQWVDEVRQAFAARQLHPTTWLSPARQQSFQTPALLAQAGFDICLDWEMDEVPVAMTTDGGTLTALPLSNELDDRVLLIDRRQSEEDWVSQILAAVDYLCADYQRFGTRCLGISLTPYVIGQPFRIHALAKLLSALSNDMRVSCATASGIVASYRAASQSSTS